MLKVACGFAPGRALCLQVWREAAKRVGSVHGEFGQLLLYAQLDQ